MVIATIINMNWRDLPLLYCRRSL